MIRRWSSGKFRPVAPLSSVPLFAAALHARSEPHIRGNATRRARWLALRNAATAMLRAEIDARVEAF